MLTATRGGMPRRVVVTGAGAVSPLGSSWAEVEPRLRARRNAVVCMEAWKHYTGLNTTLAVPVTGFTTPAHYTRKRTRSMGRVALLAVRAAELALEDAGLLGDPVLRGGSAGVSFGSAAGSIDALTEFALVRTEHNTQGVNATSYVRMMSHTAAVNIGVFFGLTGRLIPTSSACTAGSQGIGYAFEAIRHGYQDIMVAGGAEELCATEATVFDTLYATSTRNDSPELTPRPFDRDRDGLVVGEGGGALILEERERARARGARIYCEIAGFGTNCDGTHVTYPNRETMQRCLELALADAGLGAAAIGYVNAHGTATESGDIAESHATAGALGGRVPISSLKSYMGHTLGACGALEAWMSIEMMNGGWFAPTVNLDHLDPRCAELDYIVDDGRELDCEHVMSNNFAFGGINTSLVFRREV
ncbi:MAG TPA: beta-ketoacyl-ACP synthase [Gammaproteobacteria bacterium]|nr:beta-ketoacyl-ACP synthase [Gammaproteobacteria bacterium]